MSFGEQLVFYFTIWEVSAFYYYIVYTRQYIFLLLSVLCELILVQY